MLSFLLNILHHTQLKFIQSFTVIACDSVHFLAYMHDDNDGDNEDDDNDNDIESDANPVTRVSNGCAEGRSDKPRSVPPPAQVH